jgi:hypothetical protein
VAAEHLLRHLCFNITSKATYDDGSSFLNESRVRGTVTYTVAENFRIVMGHSSFDPAKEIFHLSSTCRLTPTASPSNNDMEAYNNVMNRLMLSINYLYGFFFLFGGPSKVSYMLQLSIPRPTIGLSCDFISIKLPPEPETPALMLNGPREERKTSKYTLF